MGTLVNLNRVVVPSKAQASLSVALRVRPIIKAEQAKNNKRDIIRVIDDKVVVVLDPDEAKDYLDQVQNRTKEKRYTFDVAYGTEAHNNDVYQGSIQELAAGVSRGLNGTVFAYGSTGSGKTHTMVGTPADPGLMVLSLSQIFREKAAYAQTEDEEFTVTMSYLEVYNEVIYDLLVKNSGPLELREDPDLGVCVAGLKRISVTSAAEIMGLLEDGNTRRKTDSTDANATSSRSHAVLEIVVRRTPRNHYRATVLMGKLTLVDLAGSERAAETNNNGQKLRDGANINKSLLALANCINALGKQQKAGVAYVPYRNSKLTRLLKDSLQGNSRTAMVATISAAGDQYHHSVNTLKYADRAKEIKTHVVKNVGSVERHITDYQNIIDNLQNEVQSLKSRLAERHPGPSTMPASEAADGAGGGGHLLNAGSSGGSGAAGAAVNSSDSDLLAWIDGLAQEINDNVEERINLQKALFELEDINVCNKYELQNIESMLAATDALKDPDEAAEAAERRAVLVEEMAGNDAEAERYRADIAANEAGRREIQAKIESAIDANNNVNFLKILSTFRIQAVRLQELKFQMAVRDQIITEQRDVISNLWAILEASGLTRDQVLDIARAEGIVMQGWDGHDEGPSALSTLPAGSGASAGAGTAGAAGGSVTSMTVNGGVVLPGAPTGVQQSLLAGKARFRYRFWQQYSHTELNSSSSGLALQAVRSSVLGPGPGSPGTSRAKGTASRKHAAHLAPSGSDSHPAPIFPALPAGKAAVGSSNAAAPAWRSKSPLGGWPTLDQPHHQQDQQQRQQPQGHGLKIHPQLHHHLPQPPGEVSFTGGHDLKRYVLPTAAAGAVGSNAQQNMRRHSVGSTNVPERMLSDPSSSSNPVSAVDRDGLSGNNGRRPRSGRRRHKGKKQRNSGSAALTAEASSSSGVSPAEFVHPGSPGHQKQLEFD
eukprot:gene10422-10580_t